MHVGDTTRDNVSSTKTNSPVGYIDDAQIRTGDRRRSGAYTNGTPNTGTSEPTITPPHGHGVERDAIRGPHPPPEVDASEASADG